MSFIEKGLYRIKNGKRTINRPIFLREFNSENNILNDLIKLSGKVKGSKKELINHDIKLIRQELEGDEKVYHELKNSYLPMLCLYNIRLQYDNYIAQYDFIIITNKSIFVLETKTLNHDVEITHEGNFVKITRNECGKLIKKEGMCNPISQNEIRVKILKDILLKEKLIRNFNVTPIVVMTNTKKEISEIDCPKVIKDKIHKYDQVVNVIENVLECEKDNINLLEKYLYAIGIYLMENNKPISFDYMSKYAENSKDFLEHAN